METYHLHRLEDHRLYVATLFNSTDFLNRRIWNDLHIAMLLEGMRHAVNTLETSD